MKGTDTILIIKESQLRVFQIKSGEHQPEFRSSNEVAHVIRNA